MPRPFRALFAAVALLTLSACGTQVVSTTEAFDETSEHALILAGVRAKPPFNVAYGGLFSAGLFWRRIDETRDVFVGELKESRIAEESPDHVEIFGEACSRIEAIGGGCDMDLDGRYKVARVRPGTYILA